MAALPPRRHEVAGDDAQVTHRCLLSATQDDAVDLVDLVQLDLDAVAARGRQVLADVVGPDRQLAVAAVGENGELDAIGASVLDQRVDRGADRAAGVEDVVDEDHRAALELELEPRVAHERLRPARRAARRGRGRRRGET